MSRAFVFLAASVATVLIGSAACAQAAGKGGETKGEGTGWCSSIGESRTVCADVVALDQTLVYNRFGSFNPFGMIFALRRDVVPTAEGPEKYDADACGQTDGTETHGAAASLTPGAVRLKDCKRPRPMVLRANAGDVLRIRVQNLLRDSQPRYSEDFCRSAKAEPATGRMWELLGAIRSWVSEGPADRAAHKEADCSTDTAGRRPDAKAGQEPDTDAPATRLLSMAIQGLTLVPSGVEADDRTCLGQRGMAPGAFAVCTYRIDDEGTYFLSSTAAPAGGEGDGGSITHGLFGAVIGEPKGSAWYRSQITAKAFRDLWGAKSTPRHAVRLMRDTFAGLPDGVGGVPILAMAKRVGDGLLEIVHSDLNAIVERDPATRIDGRPQSFREFSVFFHDELKAFYTRNFSELGKFGEGQLAGVRDGFAINYGSSGMGAALLANRKGIGPAANCAECLYEEFFLTSWANGDPALLEQFSDDPSNVHHSYLNDPIVFRNFHAGPKETHVFHLHAHQWFSGNDANRGTYLDSQTVAPQQGFTYDIYGGGMQIYRRGAAGEKGWYETLGSGNRNRTVGDSIFHCHLYPHFAQGMWELWRVHDALEDGTRKLPDGQREAGLSLAEMSKDTRARKRPGSVSASGAWINPAAGAPFYSVGTPTPALVPLPGEAWPLLPTYSGETTVAEVDEGKPPEVTETRAFPGYPYYIGGKPGHRPAQAPLDIARATAGDGVPEGEYLDGGLPRHIVLDAAERKPGVVVPEGFLDAYAPDAVTDLASAETNAALRKREARQTQLVAKMLALGNLTMHLEKAPLKLLPYDGTALEKAAMAFHHNGAGLDLLLADGSTAEYDMTRGGYARAAASSGMLFAVNGGKAKPGAPFADPCAAPDSYRMLVRVPGAGSEPARYTFEDRPLYFTPGAVDQIPAGATPVAARDEEVSNWVKWRRSDDRIAKRPTLYYLDGDQRPTALAGGDLVTVSEVDPFTGEAGLTTDPAVIGFRRYKASAVQLDMVTNRAGWHDPQARINVLTERSHLYKGEIGEKRISPLISASEQPFFFRALSGECIEFRHTNELPKELALDDFQVKTPTDTIGQHIHLVKFDVTSSDGSGNGFNYEDGTFAPDEIASRICAAKNAGMATYPQGDAAAPRLREYPGLCRNEAAASKPPHWVVDRQEIWRLSMEEGNQRRLFQTTTQRWFADPLLSPVRRKGDGGTKADGSSADKDNDFVDRTLRTVFSHDHFGPSSIQQHGFYTALLIEPQGSQTCEVDGKDCTSPRIDRRLINAGPIDVGRDKIVVDFDTLDDVSSREFALAIADFATLYDPSDTMAKETLLAAFPDRKSDSTKPEAALEEPKLAKGMATLYCEAKYALLGQTGNMNEYCGSGLKQKKDAVFAVPGNVSPAWLAAAMPRDTQSHSEDLFPGLITATDVDGLRAYLTAYRQKAAGNDSSGVMARPVAAVKRPESISVDHHDPYLVNYRGEPIPLRIGTDTARKCQFKDDTPEKWVGKLEAGISGSDSCSIAVQKKGGEGDLANVFLSAYHNDPVTHIMKTMTGDHVLFRLIQGAQEVQHTFTLEGYTWPRNIDQRFPSAAWPHGETAPRATLTQKCDDATFLAGGNAMRLIDAGHADEYFYWLRNGAAGLPDSVDFWEAAEQGMASCFNREGRVSAQEVGISEHFEFSGTYRNDVNTERFGATDPLANAADLPSDTLQHFGSQDALWNGAWSLLRTYPRASKEIAGIAQVQAKAEALKRKLGDSAKNRFPEGVEAERAGAFANTQPAACRYEAPVVHAAVVAIETRTVFGPDASVGDTGVAYGEGLYDRNGLFLAQVDPMAVANRKPAGIAWPDYLESPDAWRNIRLETVVKAVRAAYAHPEPLVLPVKAGDCVVLTVINALRDHTGVKGLIDDLGDARMPAITALNTEPEWATRNTEEELGPWHFKYEDGANVRPSSRLALMLPLPTLSYTNAIARPFGVNATGALAGLAAGGTTLTMDEAGTGTSRTAQIEQISFYAGRAAAKSNEDLTTVTSDENHAEDFVTALNAALAGALPGRTVARLSGIDPADKGAFVFAGRRYKVSVTLSDDSVADLADLAPANAPARPAVDRLWRAYARLSLSEKINFMPYAYGALPLKSMGDVIGHPTHGLVGAVDVLPAGAVVSGETRSEIGRLTFERDLCDDATPSSRGQDCKVLVTRPVVGRTGRVDPFGALRISTRDPQGGVHDIRSFTLFWQDGLNLRDRSTADTFAARDGRRPRLVSDCRICDDTYDFGDQGVSYRASPFHIRLRKEPDNAGLPQAERHTDLNAYRFPAEFFRLKQAEIGGRGAPPVLKVVAGEEIVVHVVHPGGRARQHAFAMIGQNYNDLFPGFGFPRSALVAPGKAITASLTRKAVVGCYLFHDGPTYLQAGGLWGLVDVVATEKDLDDPARTSCARAP